MIGPPPHRIYLKVLLGALAIWIGASVIINEIDKRRARREVVRRGIANRS